MLNSGFGINEEPFLNGMFQFLYQCKIVDIIHKQRILIYKSTKITGVKNDLGILLSNECSAEICDNNA